MIGIDEVGRGAWAGPLLVVAFRQKTELPAGVTDSKLLSKAKRTELAKILHEYGDIGEGWVEPSEVDDLGLTAAMNLAVERALTAIAALADENIIMDGTINYCHQKFINVKTAVKADQKHPEVSAASIVAKVLRDTFMEEISQKYPGYDFEKHVGYGTKLHAAALNKIGISDIHRRSYAPIRRLL